MKNGGGDNEYKSREDERALAHTHAVLLLLLLLRLHPTHDVMKDSVVTKSLNSTRLK